MGKIVEYEPTQREKAYLLEPTNQHAIFQEAGTLAGAVTYGHLVFELDFVGLGYLTEILVAARERLEADVTSGRAKKTLYLGQYKIEIKYDRQRLDDLLGRIRTLDGWFSGGATRSHRATDEYNITTNDTLLDRQARIPILLPLIGLGAIFGTTLGIFNTIELSRIQGAKKGEPGKEFIINKIQEQHKELATLAMRLNQTQEVIKVLQETVKIDAERTYAYMDAHAQATAVYDSIDVIIRDYEISLGALFQQQLHPLLLKKVLLDEALGELASQAAVDRFVIPSADSSFLLQLPCSFLMDVSRKLTVFIHVPLLRPNTIMTLYKYIDMPYAVENSMHAVSLNTEADYLAVNLERDSFLPITPDRLNSCHKIGSLNLCPDTNYLLKDFATYCIAALFNRPDAVTTACSTRIAPARFALTQVRLDEFYLYHPYETALTLECVGSTSMETFRGVHRLVLPPNCYGYSRDYTVSTHNQYSLNYSVVITRPHIKVGDLVANFTPSMLDMLMPFPTLESVPVSDLVAEYWAIERNTLGSPWTWTFGLSFTTIAIILGLVALLIFFRHRLLRAIHALTAEVNIAQEKSDSVEVALRRQEVASVARGGNEYHPPPYPDDLIFRTLRRLRDLGDDRREGHDYDILSPRNVRHSSAPPSENGSDGYMKMKPLYPQGALGTIQEVEDLPPPPAPPVLPERPGDRDGLPHLIGSPPVPRKIIKPQLTNGNGHQRGQSGTVSFHDSRLGMEEFLAD